MSGNINIQAASGTWVVRAAGAVLGESNNALELTEDGYETVIYFPRGDISMAFFDQSDTASKCPHKGMATHFNLEAKSGTIADAAWSYENPIEAVAPIAGHLAFYTSKVTVEQL